jgi:phage FluMu gp28-like protein
MAVAAAYTRPPITDYQRAFIDDPARYTVVEASTKVGKTVGCIIWLTERALQGRPSWNYWWVAPVYPQAAIAFRRLKTALRDPRTFSANESELRITLANQTVIWFKSAEKPDNLYGEDVHAAVIDEATRVREEAWHAIRTTLTATRGPLKIIGNVKGRRNWAYQMARLSETATLPDTAYFRITAWDAVEAGILKREEVEDARRVLPAHVFRQDYEAIPADDGGNPFGLTAIEACLEPLSQAEPAVWGWDLAKAQDWTVGVALDRQARVCRLERWQAPWRATKADVIQMSKQAPSLMDSTGVGDPILEDVQAAGMFAEGFHFTGPSKQQLMEGLAAAIHQRDVRFPDGVLRQELDAFEYEYRPSGVRYAAPEGMHDDCVMALGLAVRHWRAHVGMASVESAALRAVLSAYESDNGDAPRVTLADPRVW